MKIKKAETSHHFAKKTNYDKTSVSDCYEGKKVIVVLFFYEKNRSL